MYIYIYIHIHTHSYTHTHISIAYLAEARRPPSVHTFLSNSV